MTDVESGSPGRFCWLDLAAADAAGAARFYGGMFGWTPHEHHANGGTFTRLRSGAADVGSLYQMGRQALRRGMASHWTPYVRVDDVDAAARRAGSLGGAVLVPPFVVAGVARIALVADVAGARFGLWGPVGEGPEGRPHG